MTTSPSPDRHCPPRHPRDLRTHRGPALRPLLNRILAFDLNAEADALRGEHGWRDNGHSAKTLVKHHEQRIVLIAVKAGTRMTKHRAAGAVSIQVLSGRLHVQVGAITMDVRAGHLLALDRALSHDVDAIEDTNLVLSISSSPAKRRTS
jgi:quercetin dioxygenase-like cupin family protein